jgi:hypothetical protein
VGVKDSLDEKGVLCEDCTAEAEGGVDPMVKCWVNL